MTADRGIESPRGDSDSSPDGSSDGSSAGSSDGSSAGSSAGPGAIEERRARWADTVLAMAEDIVYVGIAVLLVITSGVLLVLAGKELLDVLDGLAVDPVVEVLDTLLLLFIFVELLFAVRTTIAKRELVAEPFLLVGIIVSIKEIVVLSVKAAESIGQGEEFRDQMWQVGVLGGVVLVLGLTAWLLRIKEREPAEADGHSGP